MESLLAPLRLGAGASPSTGSAVTILTPGCAKVCHEETPEGSIAQASALTSLISYSPLASPMLTSLISYSPLASPVNSPPLVDYSSSWSSPDVVESSLSGDEDVERIFELCVMESRGDEVFGEFGMDEAGHARASGQGDLVEVEVVETSSVDFIREVLAVSCSPDHARSYQDCFVDPNLIQRGSPPASLAYSSSSSSSASDGHSTTSNETSTDDDHPDSPEPVSLGKLYSSYLSVACVVTLLPQLRHWYRLDVAL
jgi:hypothetical protein